jgi:alpha-tubulin suppressor-like RCC1 family protein
MQVKAVVSSPYQPIVQENIIAAGYNHTIVIKADGSLWAWGNNECGELGDGTNTACSTPVKIMDGVGAVSCAYLYTIAIKTDGTLWA